MTLSSKNEYSTLIDSIGSLLEHGRKQAFQAVNQILIQTYWQIGKRIVEYEQNGRLKAEYGSALLDNLSNDLKLRYGKGFSRRNILDMRRFYLSYPKWQTVSAELSWSHYVELLSIDDALERSFYEKQCVNERWSVRDLSRQMNSALFHRLALSKDKRGIMELSKRGLSIQKHEDIVKDPYVLEFLKIPESHRYTEKELEQKLIDNLQMFLLELGKGFTFVARQKRISLGNNHYYVDLVFYHRILRCFVLIDIKLGKAMHQDIGQMNLYLNYFKKEESTPGDNEPIGIVLSAYKNEVDVEFALGGIVNKLFVSKYRLFLPDRKELENKLKMVLEEE